MTLKLFTLFFCLAQLLISVNECISQDTIISKESGLNLKFGIGKDYPLNDLAVRFGSNENFSVGLEYKLYSNFVFGSHFTFLFGSNVKENPIINLRNDDNNIFGIDGLSSSVYLRERAIHSYIYIGKHFGLNKSSSQFLTTSIGVGLLAHKIKILDDSRAVASLNSIYIKGYDNLTRGLAITEQIGYGYTSRLINFDVIFESTQARTEAIRKIDFATGENRSGKRLDVLVGLKLLWKLPLIRNSNRASETYFY